MLSMVGLVGGLMLLITLSLRGMNLFFAAPLCALIVALTGGITVFDTLGTDSFVRGYMHGFGNFIQAWFFVFLLGSLFGKLMEGSGAAHSLSHWVIEKLGVKHAVLAVVAACALLTYGGVSVFVVAFSVYPMAVSLFQSADVPHRFIPATLAFGSVTFTMTSAGSPEIQNWIPIKYLGTTPYAAWETSAVVAVFMAVFGFIWLRLMISKAQSRGEGYSVTEGEGFCSIRQGAEDMTEEEIGKLPHPITGFIPLVVVLITAFFSHELWNEHGLVVALLAGCIALGVTNFKYIQDAGKMLSEGTYGALMAIGNTSAVVGFGTVAKLSPAFMVVVNEMTAMDGNGLLGAGIAITTIAALTGSASGGQTIALPELAPHYLEQGMNAEHLHRITSISSGALDTMPHNGYVVTTIRVICKENHKEAYWSMAALTVIVPFVGMLLAIFLIRLGLS